jgi:uncharacterized protein
MLALILDTNVVLDWLVFKTPVLIELTQAVQAGRVNVLTEHLVLHELRRVLGYPTLKLESQRQDEIYAEYQSVSHPAIVPSGFAAQNLLTPAGFPTCRDRDDQLFLALAFHTKATLVSKDNDVLKVRKKVHRFAVTILDTKELSVKLSDVANSFAEVNHPHA